MSFRRRSFPEVLDALMVEIAGGVGAEAQPFPPPGAAGPPFRQSLQQPPVAQVVSVYGSRDGEPRRFRPDADFRLAADRQTLEWTDKAELPDPGTLVFVNYVPAAAQPLLTDLQVGSVVRTLVESIGLELARLSAQLEAVNDAAFVDSATGSSLDKVVALLGITRVRGGRAVGEVQFTRAAGVRGTIVIPSGTRILSADGNVEYETTETVTLAEAQSTIRVVARDLEPNDPVAAETLTVLAAPIAGIAGVTNPAPTARAAQDETDAELRTRARTFLHGGARATLGALQHAVARQQVPADVVEKVDAPGFVEITPHLDVLEPERQQRLLAAIEDVRPAGVVVTLVGAEPPRRVNLELRLTTADGLTQQDLRAAHRAVRAQVEDYFRRLPAREPGSINQIVGRVLSVSGVQDVRLLSATVNNDPANLLNTAAGQIDIGGFPTVLGDLHIADPNLPTLLNVVVTSPADQPPADRPAIEAALTAALAYLNTLNAAELPPGAPASQTQKRVLSFGKLLRAVPLPNKPGEPLASFDEAPVPPALPDETTIAPYEVSFAFTLESGLTLPLERAADPPYTLAPFERLSLSRVVVQP